MLNFRQKTKANYNYSKIPLFVFCAPDQLKSEKLIKHSVDWGAEKQALEPPAAGSANSTHLNRKQAGCVCINFKSHTLWSAGPTLGTDPR